MQMLAIVNIVLLCIPGAITAPAYGANPFVASLSKRQNQGQNGSSNLQVDLGYEIYEGFANATTGLNIWRG